MVRERLLVVEDERAQRDALAHYLQTHDYDVDAHTTAEDAIAALRQQTYAAMITDLRLPGMDGLALVRKARELDGELAMLLITAYASVDSAVEALRVGAQDYLLKPLILTEVGRKVENLVRHRRLIRENVELRHAITRRDQFGGIIAESPAMREVVDWSQRAATSNANVLLTGETGTGKEVVARRIHDAGENRDEPFIAINLGALSDSLAESELFGHVRGAFTGADKARDGLLRAAGRGTVLLDEIAELPLTMQVKLLRALESGEVRALGSDRTSHYDARILAATHRDLESMVRRGEFREDLFYRLNVLQICLPPLRDRPEDIPPLVRALLDKHATRAGRLSPRVTAAAMRALCAYTWRGNVRELSNVLERALILADDGRIDIDQLPQDIRGIDVGSLRLSDAMERFERRHIAEALRRCGGNRDRAAEQLGISSATLYRRIEKLRLKGFEVHRGGENKAS